MKLIRFGAPGAERPGILDEHGTRRDLSSRFRDWDRSFFNEGGLERIKEYLSINPRPTAVSENERWAAPIARPGKVICIGLNYSDHAKESNMAIPQEPIVFQKGSNTVVGPYDPIVIPRGSEKTDWEVELGVVIGKNARYLQNTDEAKEYILGYCVVNDVSERAFQLERGGQWTKGKSCDNFSPTGPWLLTADEVTDVHNLQLKLLVNGRTMQEGSTKNLIFDVYYIIHYLSQFMTLEAGDLILTGTPAGVGLGMKPPVYLKSGDVVELSVEGLGEQKQVCEQA
ncbi:ureidoglycolate lyase [Parapedobacter defluvii]|uniref:Ureidoglycolate lyase n=2 Tax=Parapedobacter defluvii TaxID=2045106 RepID=A0ABQ1L348_9SPHI|nr:fumarylacetoacetate hydrolase family protein [Parapedobacter defluvii]RQP17886.1 MAG: FAA hydrolase family protein [Parapedobacter sp.]GGC15576.1 ureidoglycolate lyase [Parapedobacter defluvii]